MAKITNKLRDKHESIKMKGMEGAKKDKKKEEEIKRAYGRKKDVTPLGEERTPR